MAYTVLARKYRSTTFDELVGQEHVAKTLKRAISSGRIAHAFLFCGTRGTGKTSTARLLAKALNCQSSDKPVTEPCNKCGSCAAVARGDDIDVIEIDAASNTGVDNVRDLINNAQYSPARSRFKIYIIDEVHMLSKQAFNALLKTMEEPPEHVKFILATTEPEKVLATILSRCQRYDFRNIPTREIAQHLKEICGKEQIDADADALLLVAKAGAGSMRDALSLLDRLLSVGEKTLTVEMIEQLLGLPRTQLIFDLAQAIGEGNVASVLGQTDAMLTSGLAPETLIAQLTEHVRNLLILRTCGAESRLVEVPGMPISNLVQQASRFDPVVLTQDITILEELRRQIRVSSAGRALVDATLVRLALAEQFTSISELIARTGGEPVQKKKYDAVTPVPPVVVRPVIEPSRAAPVQLPSVESVSVVSAQSSSVTTVDTPPVAPVNIPPVASVVSQPVTESASPPTADVSAEVAPVDDDADDALPAVGKVWDDGPKLSLGEIMKRAKLAEQQSARATAPPVAQADHDPDGKKARLLKIIEEAGALMALGVLSQGRIKGVEDGRVVILLPPQQESFIKNFERNTKRDLIRGAIADVFGAGVGIQLQVDTTPTPATASPGTSSSAPRPTPRRSEPDTTSPAQVQTNTIPLTPELRDSLSQDPLVSAIIKELNGSIVRVE